MPYPSPEQVAAANIAQERNLDAWRDEVARRMARKIEGEARAKDTTALILKHRLTPGMGAK